MFPELVIGNDREALRFGDTTLTYGELARRSGQVAAGLRGRERVAVWATPTVDTCVAVVGALVAGVPVVPVNPKTGERELTHIVADSAPDLLLAAPDADLPAGLADLPRLPVPTEPRDVPPAGAEPDPETPAFIVYTSGTTGAPKGVVLPRRAVEANLDALAEVWEWTADDVLVHGLPLFHVHGLIIGVVGPLRRGGRLHHLGRFTSPAAAAALAGGGTMMFGVPTMYHRLALDCAEDPALAAAVGGARLLVSGS
ncbi:MAG: AMP-binding protein, partial [Pseudonocardiaceae bacterium]|nr:AMP-binding protein [Pseudonocardiaceae bacterium]